MKFVVFGLACALAFPVMMYAAYTSERLRGWLLATLIMATAFGPRFTIHLTDVAGYRGTEDGFIVTLADVVALPVALALMARFPSRLQWLPYNWTWLMGFFVLAIVSTLQSAQPDLGVLTLFTLARAYLIYWVACNLLVVGTSLRYVWVGLVGVGFIVTLASVRHVLGGVERVSALFAHSNTIPSYCFMVLPALLMWGLCDRSLDRREVNLTLAAVLGMSFSIVETLSRAGLVLLGAVFAVCLAVALWRVPSRRVRLATALFAVVALAGSVVMAAKIMARFDTAPTASAIGRHEFNAAAVAMASDRFLGVGPNNYPWTLTNDREYRQNLRVLRTESSSGVCHNIYLLTAAETGFPGLIIFLVITLRFGWMALYNARGLRSAEELVLFGMVVGWGALLAAGWLEWVLRQPPVMYMYGISAAFALALARQVQAHAVAVVPFARRGGPGSEAMYRPGTQAG